MAAVLQRKKKKRQQTGVLMLQLIIIPPKTCQIVPVQDTLLHSARPLAWRLTRFILQGLSSSEKSMICCTGSQTGNEKLQNDYPSHIVMLDLDRQRGCLLGLLAKFYIFCRCEELICSQRRVSFHTGSRPPRIY